MLPQSCKGMDKVKETKMQSRQRHPCLCTQRRKCKNKQNRQERKEGKKKAKKRRKKLIVEPYQMSNHVLLHPEAQSNTFPQIPCKAYSYPTKNIIILNQQNIQSSSPAIPLFTITIFISQFLQTIYKYQVQPMKRQTQVKELEYQYREYLENGYTIPKNTQIGDYTIQGQVGVGGFGKIYHATNKRNQDFALKVMDIEKVQEERNPRVKEIKKRLLENEPKLMQLCNSPNVLKCFQIFANDSLKVLVLEYCNGKTLQQYLDQKGKIPEDEAVKILRQIINGIAELHNHNIIHRDLKADNIMEHEGEYKIIDLGFSKKLDIMNEEAEVQGTTLGTVTTMAPEVLAKLSYGLKADIWSIGVIFFQMVFGVYLYDSISARQRLKQIEEKNYFDLNKELTFNGTTISKNANNFLKRVLEVNTQKRIGWRELLEHPLIKKQENQKIGDRFLFQRKIEEPVVDLDVEFRPSNAYSVDETEVKRVPSTIEEKIEENEVAQQKPASKPKNRFKIDVNYQSKEKPKEPEKVEPYEETPVQNDRWSVQLKKQEQIRREQRKKVVQGMKPPSKIKVFDSEQYMWVKLGHLQCLKTELVYYQIVVPIENQRLLNLQNREAVEFMFLITARCFNNMSPISDRLARESNKSNIKVRNLYQQVQELYKKVNEKFMDYSNKLTAIQNNFWQIITDFFRKRFLKKNYEEKSAYTSGIQISNSQTEKISQQYGDYNKKDQIVYTQNTYIDKILSQISSSVNSQKVAKYLKHYTAIMTITLAELQKQTFGEFVRRVTSS